jgi:hypothetical protein
MPAPHSTAPISGTMPVAPLPSSAMPSIGMAKKQIAT